MLACISTRLIYIILHLAEVYNCALIDTLCKIRCLFHKTVKSCFIGDHSSLLIFNQSRFILRLKTFKTLLIDFLFRAKLAKN